MAMKTDTLDPKVVEYSNKFRDKELSEKVWGLKAVLHADKR